MEKIPLEPVYLGILWIKQSLKAFRFNQTVILHYNY